MMPIVSVGWDVLAFVLCLVGFFFLVFANEREGRRLLRRPASQRERRICAVASSGLLMLALWVCVQEWRGNFGSVLWFGWLTVAALALIFALASGMRKAMKPTRNTANGIHHQKRARQAATPWRRMWIATGLRPSQ
jgi:heme exporter protein D